jgi:hypothetical protein
MAHGRCGEKPNAVGTATRQEPKAVMLYFVNPVGAGGRPFNGARQTRLDEVREGTQTPQHDAKMKQFGARVESDSGDGG